MSDSFITKDNGQRRTFDTGARRDQATGKGRFDLLNWDMIERDAQLLERGALKYDDNNWKKGIPLKSFLDSAVRHLSQLIRGDRSEDHAAAVRWNVSGYEWTRTEIQAGRLPSALADGAMNVLTPVIRQPDDFAAEPEPRPAFGVTSDKPERRLIRRRRHTIDPDTVGRSCTGSRGAFGRRSTDSPGTQFPF